MEFQNSYILHKDPDQNTVVYKGDPLQIYGPIVYFHASSDLTVEELYNLFDGTPTPYHISTKDGKVLELEYTPKRELKPRETKVSFDFDGTLTKDDIQQYAIELVDKGYDVWIHTLRMDDKEYDYAKDWNKDVYKIANLIRIPKEKIIFCNMEDKWNFLKGKDFLWHIDDDSVECNMINRYTTCKGICHFGNSTWKNKCEKLLK